MEKKKKKIMIVAGEISGDLYGYPLVREILEARSDLDVFGVGGPRMKSTGMRMLYDSSSWGTIGLVEALKKFPHLYRVYNDMAQKLSQTRPDLLVLIDYPGFNMRLCRYAKKLGIPTLYYFPPSKWTSNPSDVSDAARNITKVAAPFRHTAEVYRKAGANVEFVSNPLLEIVRPSMGAAELRKRFKVPDGSRIIALMPGSRFMEVKYMLPILVDSASLMAEKVRGAHFVMPISSSTISKGTGITLEYIRSRTASSKVPISIELDATYDILSISDFAVITSGTATLEAACLGVPMLIVYKVSLLTELFARSFTSLPKYFGLPNLILNRPVVPEFIQRNVSAESVAGAVAEILNSPEKIADIRNGLLEVVKNLGDVGATSRVADIILKMIG